MQKHAVMVNLQNPLGIRHGGESRIRSLKAALASNGIDVSEVIVPQAPTGEASTAFWRLAGRMKRSLWPQPVSRRLPGVLAEVIGNLSPSSFVLSTVPTATYALAAAGVPRLWGDFFDLPYRFAMSEAAYRRPVTRLTSRQQARGLKRRHLRLAPDMVATFAGYGDFLSARSATANALWLPGMIEDQAGVQGSARSARGALRAGFLANFHYWPNRDALDVLVRDWLPGMVEAGVEIVVAGFGSGQVAVPPAVNVLGEVLSPADFYEQVDVVLVPVRRGGGVKMKAIEALRWELPVIVDAHVLDGFPPNVARFLWLWGDPATFELLSTPGDRIPQFSDADRSARAAALAPFSERSTVQVVRDVIGRLEADPSTRAGGSRAAWHTG